MHGFYLRGWVVSAIKVYDFLYFCFDIWWVSIYKTSTCISRNSRYRFLYIIINIIIIIIIQTHQQHYPLALNINE